MGTTTLPKAISPSYNHNFSTEAYSTEEAVALAIHGLDRTTLVLSTKKRTGGHITADEVRKSLEDSLGRLETDYMDIYHLHGALPQHYD